MNDEISINLKRWDELVNLHFQSKFYDVQSFINGKNTIPELEQRLLGDISGKKILHLQCHFGMDTLSLARMGAIVTGIDFSSNAILTAEKLRDEVGISEDHVKFIQADIMSVNPLEMIDNDYDMVFTTHGTISWLPDLFKWATLISYALKTGGNLFFMDTHPLLSIFEGDMEMRYNYFHTGKPSYYEYEYSYASDTKVKNRSANNWTYDMAYILNSLINAGLTIQRMEEYPFLAWKFFDIMKKRDDGYFYFPENSELSVPMMLLIIAEKN